MGVEIEFPNAKFLIYLGKIYRKNPKNSSRDYIGAELFSIFRGFNFETLMSNHHVKDFSQ